MPLIIIIIIQLIGEDIISSKIFRIFNNFNQFKNYFFFNRVFQEFVNHRKLTEFGNIDLIERREELEGGDTKIRLPGVRKGDMAARSLKPEIRVYSLSYSPTGRSLSQFNFSFCAILSFCILQIFGGCKSVVDIFFLYISI